MIAMMLTSCVKTQFASQKNNEYSYCAVYTRVPFERNNISVIHTITKQRIMQNEIFYNEYCIKD